jgi:hypothetical protein
MASSRVIANLLVASYLLQEQETKLASMCIGRHLDLRQLDLGARAMIQAVSVTIENHT